jgi:hypothetical protein
MNNSKFPEDSILKRHFDATVEMKRQVWMQTPPTDSILHRHAMSVSNHPDIWASNKVKKSTAATHTISKSVSRASAGAVSVEKKGFFSWLFSILRST